MNLGTFLLPAPPSRTHLNSQLNLAALTRIGLDLFDAGALSEARDVFRLLLVYRPKEPSTWYWLARCHQELDQSAVARTLFELAASAGHSSLFRALARGIADVDGARRSVPKKPCPATEAGH